jgi:D-glycero-D-manno-heptose 1,7-bisphosphate phosphatase
VAAPGSARAVFLDRDGVILEEDGLLVDPGAIRVAPGVPQALARLRRAGFELVVVTNQPVVARGLTSEEGVAEIHEHVGGLLAAAGAEIRAFYVCPHHPSADVPEYRVACDCRKPRPGLLLRAAKDVGIDLSHSFMVGDRLSDVAAGARAGCRTILVRTGAHLEAPIETPEPFDPDLTADHVSDGVANAVDWIIANP